MELYNFVIGFLSGAICALILSQIYIKKLLKKNK